MSFPNKLITEKSPYLLQHAHNPVDWFPWGEVAFEKAKKEDKPIFLSIGYSTCYWCHVMEREVFEVEDIAKIMNDFFVNIKVDREERPDVDRVYMAALQSMTGSGGWPISMFLTPELKPFYGATYIPPTSKYGLPGFEDLIQQIHEIWKTKRQEIESSGNKIINHIKKNLTISGIEVSLDERFLSSALEQFKNGFDEEYGGFGGGPKFPRPVVFNFLLRAFKRFNDNDSLKMVVRTLLRIAKGGIHDHLGGGFHRYSVDRFWIVPHFEKMLYDQAQLVISYIEAFQITHDIFFANVARDILNYAAAKLTDKNGGFYSAEDAESFPSKESVKKEEGAFYIWEKKEIDGILDKKNSEIFCYFFGIGERGNTPAGSDPHDAFLNKNILWNAHSLSDTSNKFGISTDEANRIIEESKKILYETRGKRPHPYLDDKILVSWNGLMISAFAKAFQVFGDEMYLKHAEKSADFIFSNLFNNKENALFHRYRDGEARFEGTLEDYSFFVQSLIDLYESCFKEKYLSYAVNLTNSMVSIFYDNEHGGFFDISEKDKSILVRTKEDYDSAEPSGNSIAILSLLRLFQLTENNDYYELARNSLKYFSSKISEQSTAMPQMLCALDFYLQKPKQIIISGKKDSPVTKDMLKEVYKFYLPNKILIYADPEKLPSQLPFLNSIIKKSDKTLAFICENYTCKLPIDNIEELRNCLNLDLQD